VRDPLVTVSVALSLPGERTPKIVQVEALNSSVVFGYPRHYAHEAVRAYARKRRVEEHQVCVMLAD
jgi:hypothetical protein